MAFGIASAGDFVWSTAPWAVVVLAAAVIAALAWVLNSRKRHETLHAGGPQTPDRLRVFAKWAQQHIEETPVDAHRQVLDDVIFSFAAYAQRLEKGESREARRAAVSRLRVLIELLETPSVNRALRGVNWAWLREWERQLLEPREARMRCTVVFPTICAAAKLQIAERRQAWLKGRSRPADDPSSLAYLAAWCQDFLDRPDTRAFLGVVGAPANMESGVGWSSSFASAGALYSDSDDDDDDASPYGHTGRNGGRSRTSSSMANTAPAGGGGSGDGYLEFSRRKYEGQEHCWTTADATETMVRGAQYLTDHIKVHSKPAMLELIYVDLLKSNDEMVHYTKNPKSKIEQLRRDGDNRFFFVLNFRLCPIQLAVIWAVPKDPDWVNSPEGLLFQRFCQMSDKERNTRLKVLPKVVDGPWLVKKSVPDRPGVVGRKLSIEYFLRQDHLEVSINCISSPAGRRLVQLLTGAARHFSMEVFIILEGQSVEELPERVLCGMGVHHGDLNKIAFR